MSKPLPPGVSPFMTGSSRTGHVPVQRWGRGDEMSAAPRPKGQRAARDPSKGKQAEEVVSAYLSLTAKDAFSKKAKGDKRPFMASECKDLRDCERYRMQVIGEIVRKVGELQNHSLGEFRIRELNDEANKLIREKGFWQRQIIALGGPNYFVGGGHRDHLDELGGVRAYGSGGYLYFGAAKSLPGVRELFEVTPKGPQKRTRAELYKSITPDYYGFGDEEDAALLKAERRAEKRARDKAIADFREAQAKRGGPPEYKYDVGTEEEFKGFAALVKVPSQADVEARMLAAKKREILLRYGIALDEPPLAHDAAAERARTEDGPPPKAEDAPAPARAPGAEGAGAGPAPGADGASTGGAAPPG
eukprot:TRINITY_DN26897_c0_g1_i1.p1 TRINITY_DN26897_c0_g1~~TRINITY_DN26897_c0_g1_i1.p1  ORF type:complete len:360 (+),score=114.41 TRINITY_DN26897_c0_g1_i1:84-1163(+)